jgi:hypothetical protein
VVVVVRLQPVKEMSGAGGLARLAAVVVGQVLRAVTAMAWVALATAATELRHLLPDQVSLMAAAVEVAATRRAARVVQVVVVVVVQTAPITEAPVRPIEAAAAAAALTLLTLALRAVRVVRALQLLNISAHNKQRVVLIRLLAATLFMSLQRQELFKLEGDL